REIGWLNMSQVEGDALVARGDRSLRVAAEMCWHVGDLVSATLASRDPPAQAAEGRTEGHLDVVRLQSAGARLIHRCLDLVEVGRAQMICRKGSFVDEVLETISDTG